MPNRTQDRRTDRATADEVAEVERQLWEFAKRIDPPGVQEAKMRPGAFLYRIHRAWHSLGRGTGGLASRSFRALRDELLTRDPPVRNLQPKLYGNTSLSQSEAEQLIDVMLETWHLERSRNGKWQARPLTEVKGSKSADGHILDAVRVNLLHTLFKGEDNLLLEEPVGVPPEVFFEERGRSSLALILPTKNETITHLSPSNAYGGFSELIGRFFDAALTSDPPRFPLLIWVLRLPAIRDNTEFHQAFHALAVYAGALANWYFRLSRGKDRANAQSFWASFIKHSAFVVHGLPKGRVDELETIDFKSGATGIDDDLFDLDLNFFLPDNLPVKLSRLPQIRKHKEFDYNLTVSIEREDNDETNQRHRVAYWLFPGRPPTELDETAETTGMPVIDAEVSPGFDYDLAYTALYEAAACRLGLSTDVRAHRSMSTLAAMGWAVLSVTQLQSCMAIQDKLLGVDIESHRV